MSDASTPSPREIRRQRTRAAILDAAARGFGQHGFAGLSMDELAADSGVTKPTIYAHFGKKEALFDATLAAVFQAVKDRPLPGVDDVEGARIALEAHAHAIVDGSLQEPTLGLMRAAVAEALRRPDWARAMLGGFSSTTLADWLRDLDARGVLAVPDPGTAVGLFHGLVKGPLVHPTLLGAGEPPPEPDRQRVIAEGVRVFLAGFAAG
jgi:AcrR family transcriptional regulator